MDDFKNAPVSLAEVRANRERDAALWTPRDALVSMLRQIDSGMKIDVMVICYRENLEDGHCVAFKAAGGHTLTDSLGVVSRVLYKLNAP